MTQQTPSQPSRSISFGELAQSLVWPRLLGSGALSLRPARIVLAFFMIAAIGLVSRLPRLWLTQRQENPGEVAEELASKAFAQLRDGVLDLSHLRLLDGLGRLVQIPGEVFGRSAHWFDPIVVLVAACVIWAVGGGAISRSAATEFSRRHRLRWTEALGFSCSRAISLVSCQLAPVCLAAALAGLICLVGWLLLRIPFLQVAGAALFIVPIVMSLGLTLLLLCYALGTPMLIPGLACEGSDAIDSVQRAFAYVLGRPLRLAVYGFILIAQAVVLFLVVAKIIAIARTFAMDLSSKLLDPEGLGRNFRLAYFTGGYNLGDEKTITPSVKAAGTVLGFWSNAVSLVVGACVVSFYFSSSTVLYLLMRLHNDGQDPGELWMPATMPTAVDPAVAAAKAPGSDDE